MEFRSQIPNFSAVFAGKGPNAHSIFILQKPDSAKFKSDDLQSFYRKYLAESKNVSKMQSIAHKTPFCTIKL